MSAIGYIAKQMTPQAWYKRGLNRKAGGAILGKRGGVTRNIGRAAINKFFEALRIQSRDTTGRASLRAGASLARRGGALPVGYLPASCAAHTAAVTAADSIPPRMPKKPYDRMRRKAERLEQELRHNPRFMRRETDYSVLVPK
jgi:hypothetical protein